MKAKKIKYGYCQCGCGEKTTVCKSNSSRDGYKKGDHRRFVKNHSKKVIKMIGKDHPNWVGDKIKRGSVHNWLINNYGNPIKCKSCGIEGKYIYDKNGRKRWTIEYANISGKYKRDINDFNKLCHICHKKFDNHTVPKGENHPFHKLTNKEVKKIRKLYVPFKYDCYRLGREFNISYRVVHRIVTGQIWKHLL